MDLQHLKGDVKQCIVILVGFFTGIITAVFVGICIPFLFENRFFGYVTEFVSQFIVLFLLMLLSLFLWWLMDKLGQIYARNCGPIGECNEHTHKLD